MTHIQRRMIARRAVFGLAAGISVALTLSACGGGGGSPLGNATATGSADAGGAVIVGSADFPENATIAEIYAGALTAAGVTATTKLNIGSREIYFPAIKDGSIDIIPDYSGNLLTKVDPTSTATDPDAIVKALQAKLDSGLSVLEASKAEDKDAMVVTKVTAQKYNLKTIEDMAKVCDKLTVGAPPEFAERANGLAGLKTKYNCVPAKFDPLPSGPVTVKALTSDDVQVADIFTTTPDIVDQDLVVLEDPKSNWAAQQVLPLIKTDKVSDTAKTALNKVSGLLTTNDLIDLNRQVSGDQKMDPKDAAAKWLKDKGITK
ncbi:ABC transporter substrate-binding protein [Paenarthrobacter sp. PH39-S1]|uniref:ABC transporter substrate-binding protein n=1 Tax=Micrococcaceae TaxID=1268 RepID=UPI0024BAAF38|nr:ABC transporter substrate-binding protein [Paenarthrobacter sp. PH39-S1]MDJ0356034.1 ABC transporter substrate-binding protein [Paenarthrobacter sp. PH39-S1]